VVGEEQNDENILPFAWLKWRNMQKICQHYHCSCTDLDLVYFRTTLGRFYLYQPDPKIETVLWVQVLVIWVTLWIKTWLGLAVVIQTHTHTQSCAKP